MGLKKLLADMEKRTIEKALVQGGNTRRAVGLLKIDQSNVVRKAKKIGIQQGVAREAFYIIEQGIAAPEDVDKALIFGPGFRYATTGQLEIADMGGLDIWYLGSENLLKHVPPRQPAAEAKIGRRQAGSEERRRFL